MKKFLIHTLIISTLSLLLSVSFNAFNPVNAESLNSAKPDLSGDGKDAYYEKEVARQLYSNNMAAAREAASRIKDNFQRVVAYQRVSLAQFGAGDIDGARNTIELAMYATEAIDDSVLKSVSYCNLAKRQAAFGDVSEARESITKARVVFGQIKDNLVRIIVKEEISESNEYVETVDSKKITRLLSSGNTSAAREAASRITDSYDRSAAYQRVSLAQARAGDIDGARNTIELARYATEAIDDHFLKTSAYSDLAKYQATVGDIDGARESVKRARKTYGNINDPLMRIAVKGDITESEAYIEDAGKLSVNITDNQTKPTTEIENDELEADLELRNEDEGHRLLHTGGTEESDSQEITRHLVSGNMAAAGEAASRITDNFDKAVAYKRISLAQTRKGDVAGARNTIEMARQATEEIEDHVLKTSAYNDLAKYQAFTGDISGAQKTVKQAGRAFKYIKESSPLRTSIRKEVAESQEYVEEVIRKSQDNTVSRQGFRNNKTDEAKKNVTHILKGMAREFDISGHVEASKTSGPVAKGASVSDKPQDSSSSPEVNVMKSPTIWLFEKGTSGSAPVDVRSMVDVSTTTKKSEALKYTNESTPDNSRLKEQEIEHVDSQFAEMEEQLTQKMSDEFSKLEEADNQAKAQQQFDRVMGETFNDMKERTLTHIEEQFKDEPGLKEQKLQETEKHFDDIKKQYTRTMGEEWQAQQEQKMQDEADQQFTNVMGPAFDELKQKKLDQIKEQYKDDPVVKQQKLEEMERNFEEHGEQYSKVMSDEWRKKQAENRKADLLKRSKKIISNAIKDARQHERRQIEKKYRGAGVSDASGIAADHKSGKWPWPQNPEPPLLNPLWTDAEKRKAIQEWAEGAEWPGKWPPYWTYEEREAAIDIFIQKGVKRSARPDKWSKIAPLTVGNDTSGVLDYIKRKGNSLIGGVSFKYNNRVLERMLSNGTVEENSLMLLELQDQLSESVSDADRDNVLRKFLAGLSSRYRDRSGGRKLDNMVAVSLKDIVDKAEKFRDDWSSLPAEVRLPGNISRLNGFITDAEHGDIVLLGQRLSDAPPLELDDLIVGLRAVWEEGKVPTCSLDPDPRDLIDFTVGPQISRLIGVQDDSAFALNMLDADYLMKKMVFGTIDTSVQGFQSFKAVVQKEQLTDFSSARYWFYPAQPGTGDIQVSNNGQSVLFSSQLQVLSEQVQTAKTGLIVGTGKSAMGAAQSVSRSFTEHYAELAQKNPELQKMLTMTDIVLLGKVLKLLDIESELLTRLCALPYRQVDVPDTYPGIRAGLGYFINGVEVYMFGGAEMRMDVSPHCFMPLEDPEMDKLKNMLSDRNAFQDGVLRLEKINLTVPAIRNDYENFEKQYQRNVYLKLFAGDMEGALNESRLMIEEAPYDPEAWALHAWIYVLMDELEVARKYAEYARQLGPDDPKVVVLICRVFYIYAVLEGRLDEAIEELGKAARLEPDNKDILLLQGTIQAQNGEVVSARKVFKKVIKIDPSSAVAYARLAMLEVMQGWVAKARRLARKADALDPGLPEVRAVLAYTELGLGNLDRAETFATETIQLPVKDPVAISLAYFALIAVTVEREKDWSKADGYISEAVGKVPNMIPMLLVLVAKYAEESGMKDLSDKYIARARELAPDSPLVIMYTGDKLNE